jgi:DNA-directed RNA polymerase III subunit RPC2
MKIFLFYIILILHRPKLEKKDLALDALANLVIAHVPVKDFNFHSKAIYICVMVRRVLEAIKDPSLLDDRDYLGNKRLEL